MCLLSGGLVRFKSQDRSIFRARPANQILSGVFLALALFSSDLWADAGLAGQLRFEDSRQPNVKYSDTGKPWKDPEREKVLGYFAFVKEKAPGLLKRATAFRPIRVYRAKGIIYTTGGAFNDQLDNGILLPDSFFGRDAEMALRPLIHELAHLADLGNKVAHSPEWIGLVENKIDRVKAKMNQDRVTPDQEDGSRLQREIALKEGFPTGYASSNLYEALAEYVSYIVIPDQHPIPNAIHRFVNAKMLSEDFTPDDSMRQLDVAYVQFQTGNLDEAIRAFDRAIALDPSFGEAYRQRASAYEAKRQIKEAISDLTRAIALFPPSLVGAIYRDRGKAWTKIGFAPNAIEDFSNAIKYSATDAWAYFERGRVYQGIKSLDKAVADFSEAIRIAPTSFPSAYYERGRVWGAKGMGREAIADFTKAIELHPNYAQAYYARALTFVVLGERERALADFEKTKELAPGSVAKIDDWIAKTRPTLGGKGH